MIFELRNNKLAVIAETQEDENKLIDLKYSSGKAIVHKKHKKHNFMKQCDICGKKFKGNMGLGIHKASHKKRGQKVPYLNTREIQVPINIK